MKTVDSVRDKKTLPNYSAVTVCEIEFHEFMILIGFLIRANAVKEIVARVCWCVVSVIVWSSRQNVTCISQLLAEEVVRLKRVIDFECRLIQSHYYDNCFFNSIL